MIHTTRIFLLILLVFLGFSFASAEEVEQPALPSEELKIEELTGGPSPQIRGGISALETKSDGEIVTFSRYPDEINFFRNNDTVAYKTLAAEITLPLQVVFSKNAYVCAKLSEEESFYSIVMYSLADGSEICRSSRYSGELHHLLYSTDSDCFIASSNSGIIRILNPDLTEKKILTKQDGIFSVKLNDKGDRLLVFTPDRLTLVYDVSNYTLLTRCSKVSFQNILLIGDSQKAVVNTFGSGALLYDLEKDEQLFQFPGGDKVRDMVLSPDHSKVFISFIGGDIVRFNLGGETPVEEKKATSHFRAGAYMRMETESTLVTYSEDFFNTWNTETLTENLHTQAPKKFALLALTPSAGSLLAFAEDILYLYEIRNSRLIPKKQILLLNTGMLDLRAMKFYDETHAYLVGAMKVTKLDTETMEISDHFIFARPILMAKPRFCKDGKHLVTMGKDSLVTIHNLETGEITKSYQPTTFLEEAVVSPDLSLIAALSSSLGIYNIANRERVFTYNKKFVNLSFSTDGKFLYSCRVTSFTCIDVENNVELFSIPFPGTIENSVCGDKKAVIFTNKGVFEIDIAQRKLSSASKNSFAEVPSSAYNNGLFVFTDDSSRVMTIKIDL